MGCGSVLMVIRSWRVRSSDLELSSDRDCRSHSFSQCTVRIEETVVFSTVNHRSPMDVRNLHRALLRGFCHEEDLSRFENISAIELLSFGLSHKMRFSD